MGLGRKPRKAAKLAKGFTDEEREAMRDRAKEMRDGDEVNREGTVMAKLATMSKRDRAMGERIHTIIRANAPSLSPRLWYGMPAYAKEGKVVCFFQPSQKFKTRYSTLGFSDRAKLDDGSMWPNSYAVMELTAAEEAKIAALVKRAAG